MNVGELKKILEDIPDDCEIVMSSDSEGNNLSPLAFVGKAMYVPETTWSGFLVAEEDYDDYQDEGDMVTVLWPTN